jgi:hypothetical protein
MNNQTLEESMKPVLSVLINIQSQTCALLAAGTITAKTVGKGTFTLQLRMAQPV